MDKANKFVLWFNEVGIQDVPLVGGKNASLGEMYKALTKRGVKVPNGFAVTAYSYRYFLEEENIKKELRKILSKVKVRSVESLAKVGHEARQLILRAELPPPLRMAIIDAYRKLCKKYGVKVFLGNFSENKWEMRGKHELKAFGEVLGMQKSVVLER